MRAVDRYVDRRISAAIRHHDVQRKIDEQVERARALSHQLRDRPLLLAAPCAGTPSASERYRAVVAELRALAGPVDRLSTTHVERDARAALTAMRVDVSVDGAS